MTYLVRITWDTADEDVRGGLTRAAAQALADYIVDTFATASVTIEQEG